MRLLIEHKGSLILPANLAKKLLKNLHIRVRANVYYINRNLRFFEIPGNMKESLARLSNLWGNKDNNPLWLSLLQSMLQSHLSYLYSSTKLTGSSDLNLRIFRVNSAGVVDGSGEDLWLVPSHSHQSNSILGILVQLGPDDCRNRLELCLKSARKSVAVPWRIAVVHYYHAALLGHYKIQGNL